MGTAATQGELWGAKARDWAEIQEPPWIPVFEQVLDLAGVGAGTRLLDIGCGAGGALVLADARGAEPAGIDASEALIAVARERLPRARLEVGEMEELPFPDDSFDAVTGINAFQFSGDITVALAEAGRVCHPGGNVLMLVWGRPEDCAVVSIVRAALGPHLPPPASPAPQLFSPGVIESLMDRAGLHPSGAGDFGATLHYANTDTAVRAFCAAGVAIRIERQIGTEPVRAAITAALLPFADRDGGVALPNRFHWVRATA